MTRENFESVITPAGEKIAQARFAVFGKTASPDATFTLRLSYGAVKGYPMNGTDRALQDHALRPVRPRPGFDQKGAFDLPQRFWDRRDKLDLSTPVNFVCTCDIIGGNSGSPVINRNGGAGRAWSSTATSRAWSGASSSTRRPTGPSPCTAPSSSRRCASSMTPERSRRNWGNRGPSPLS